MSSLHLAASTLTCLSAPKRLATEKVERHLQQLETAHARNIPGVFSSLEAAARHQLFFSALNLAHELRHADPTRSAYLAMRACLAIRWLPAYRDVPNRVLWAAGLAFVANAYRVQGRGPVALRCLRRAHTIVSTVPSSQRAGVPALLYAFEGTLLSDYRHFGRALESMKLASNTYRALGAYGAAAQVHLSRARLFDTLGRTEEALDELIQALPLLQGSTDPVLLLTIDHMYVTFLTDLEELELASLYYSAYEWRYEAVGEGLFSLRGLWIKARLGLRCGAAEGAARALREVRDGFSERGLAYDAALAGLDQALALARLGRHDEVMALAEEMVPIFQDQGIEREMRQAMLQWADAARAKQADEATVQATLDRLTDLSRRPRPLE